jgi:hypothetical protein
MKIQSFFRERSNLDRSKKLHLQYKISMSVSCTNIRIENTGTEQLHRQSIIF